VAAWLQNSLMVDYESSTKSAVSTTAWKLLILYSLPLTYRWPHSVLHPNPNPASTFNFTLSNRGTTACIKSQSWLQTFNNFINDHMSL
jgi:hypothetical protein